MAVNSCYKRFDDLEKHTVRGFQLAAVPQELTATDRGKLFFRLMQQAVETQPITLNEIIK